MKTFTSAIASLIVFFGSCLNSSAADFCAAVLHTPLDTYNKTLSSSVKTALLDQFCSIQWSTAQELRKKADGLDSGGKYTEAYSGFFKANQNSDNQATRENFDKLCSNYNSTYSDYIFSNVGTQTSDAIVNAWRDCAVKQIGLYSAIHSVEDSEAFVIEVSYRSDAQPRPDLVVGSPSNGPGYQCHINSKEMSGFSIARNNTSGLFSIECNKTSPNSIIVTINTNQGDIGPFKLKSGLLQNLSTQVDKLREELVELRRDQVTLKKASNETLAKLPSIVGHKRMYSAGETAPLVLTNTYDKDLQCPDKSVAVGWGARWNGRDILALLTCAPLQPLKIP
jgi:hypothetical protein